LIIRFVHNNNSEPIMVDFLVLSKTYLGVVPNKRHFREHFGATPAVAEAVWEWLDTTDSLPAKAEPIHYYGYCFGGSQQLYRAVAPNF
jgi:hypothetical protein